MLSFPARNRLLAGLGVLALAAAFTIGGVAPAASAHDSVASTVPSDTEHVDLAPATVSMRFTDDTAASTGGGLPIGVTALIGALVGLGLFLGVVALTRRAASARQRTNPPTTETTHS